MILGNFGRKMGGRISRIRGIFKKQVGGCTVHLVQLYHFIDSQNVEKEDNIYCSVCQLLYICHFIYHF